MNTVLLETATHNCLSVVYGCSHPKLEKQRSGNRPHGLQIRLDLLHALFYTKTLKIFVAWGYCSGLLSNYISLLLKPILPFFLGQKKVL